MTNQDELKEKLDRVLKDYGVDWKIDDNEYYEALKKNLLMVIKE